jgi:hypothetical protein
MTNNLDTKKLQERSSLDRAQAVALVNTLQRRIGLIQGIYLDPMRTIFDVMPLSSVKHCTSIGWKKFGTIYMSK